MVVDLDWKWRDPGYCLGSWMTTRSGALYKPVSWAGTKLSEGEEMKIW